MRISARYVASLAVAGVALTTTVAVAIPASAASSSSSSSSPYVLFGSYNGLQQSTLNSPSSWLPQTQAMQSWLGRNEAVTNLYAGGISSSSSSALIPALTQVWNQAHTVPSVSWTVTDSAAENTALANGSDDSQLDAYAAALKTWLAGPDGVYGTSDDRRIYLRPDWEANGTWYGYSPDYNNPSNATYQSNVAGYVAMWQHLYTELRADGLDANHVQFVWSVNNDDAYRAATSGSGAELIANDIFPGAAYVNWIAIDGYNMGSSGSQGWQNPYGVFDDMLVRINNLDPTAPIDISEVGTLGTGAPSGQSEATWVNNYFQWLTLAEKNYPVRMTMWFNSPDFNGEFLMFGKGTGDASYNYGGSTWADYNEYKAGVVNDSLVGSSSSNPQLLTNAQFSGS